MSNKTDKITNWYIDFFTKYYLPFLGHKKNPSKTKKEVGFICRALDLSKKAKILDLACGQGRHSVELARKGYQITGLDLNKNLLNLAKKSAKKKRVGLRLIQSDMRKIPSENEFDAVISMFTYFGYFKKERENLKVLREVFKVLKPGGLFLLDLMNKKWVLQEYLGKTWQEIKKSYILEDRSFDRRRKNYLNKILIITAKKEIRKTFTLVRLYDSFEIKKKLEKIGFLVLKFYGDYNGNKFSPQKSPRMIILTKKHRKRWKKSKKS